MSLDSVIIGDAAEEAFRVWLDKVGIPYLRIDQEKDTYSHSLLRIFEAKRPDFIVLIPKLGLIFIDVKGRKSHKECFDIKKEDIDKYTNLEKNFNFKLWFTFYDPHLGDKAFYWINLQKTVEVMWIDKVFHNNTFQHSVYRIPVKECTKIGFEETKEAFLPKILT